MSSIRDLYNLLNVAYGQRNPIRDVYYQLFHKSIARKLVKRGEKAFCFKVFDCDVSTIGISESERGAIITMADKSLADIFDLLGSGDVVLNPINWSCDFISKHEWPTGTYYKKYVQVDLRKHVDVKVPRELSRFHFLLHLAIAYRFTKDKKYLLKTEKLVADWIEKNPLMYSINWGCSMDVAIRAVNWIWALSLIGKDNLQEAFIDTVASSLYQHGWFIYHNFEGHQFRYNNNHYLSDLVGLVHISCIFKGDKQADEWYAYALKEFYHEVRLQMLPSGMDYEGSTNYHRLVLELIVSTFLFLKRTGENVPQDIWARCENMFEVVGDLLMPDGNMPIVGDQDNGRCLPWGIEKLNDYRYLMSLGAMLFKRGDFKELGNGYNIYCAMFGCEDSYNSYQSIKEANLKQCSKILRDAGFALMKKNNDYLLFNTDNQGMYPDTHTTSSHTHSDWFSFVLCVEGVHFIIDPGTHVYSSDAESRNLFRSTSMHNTVVVDGQNQSKVFEKKLWDMKRTGKVIGVRWESDDNRDFVSCAHTGYEILSSPVRHQRSILFDKVAGRWSIEDLLTSKGTHTYEVHFHLADKVTATVKDKTCNLERDGVRIQMSFDSDAEMSVKVTNTYFSESYGYKVQGNEIIISLKDNSIKLVTDIIKC